MLYYFKCFRYIGIIGLFIIYISKSFAGAQNSCYADGLFSRKTAPHPLSDNTILSILYNSPKNNKLVPYLKQMLINKLPNDTVKVWVFFTDKGIFTEKDYQIALRDYREKLTDKCRARRLKSRTEDQLVDFTDLPVNSIYIQQVLQRDAKLRTVSRWLNGISIEIQVNKLNELVLLDFVRAIEPVAVYYREQPSQRLLQTLKGNIELHEHKLNYGYSYWQLNQISVPILHDLGYTGKGVTITLLDTGFDREHEALERVNIIGEKDFMRPNDDNTRFEPDQDYPGQTDHGTQMLALVGGYQPGWLIGPAYGADFLLAKTEDIGSETPIEEDNWVAGIEWAESEGTDIVSSSLGYTDWYTYDQMDGQTAITTRAALAAAGKGVLVVNALGNLGWDELPDTCIVAPADADSIISVGGVWTWSGEWAESAAKGPTADGRIKPEVVAAFNAYTVCPESTSAYKQKDRYTYGYGTSCGTALISGACALLMEAHPEWNAMQVRDALMYTASCHTTPNDSLGWGIANVNKARYYRTLPDIKESRIVSIGPNPYKPKETGHLSFQYTLRKKEFVTLEIYTLSGECIRTLELGVKLPPGDIILWDGTNEFGRQVGSGIYLYNLMVGNSNSTGKFVLIR